MVETGRQSEERHVHLIDKKIIPERDTRILLDQEQDRIVSICFLGVFRWFQSVFWNIAQGALKPYGVLPKRL